jgi:hypothetical protein
MKNKFADKVGIESVQKASDKNAFLKIGSDNIWLLALIFVISSLILTKSAYHADGYLSPDSTYYIALAQNLADGKGFVIANDGRGVAKFVPFAVWPVGYPYLIYLVSEITNTSAFWASKILNIAVIVSAMLILYKLFRPTGLYYSALLAGGAFLEIFSYSWSETVFILLLIIFSALLAKLLADAQESRRLYVLASITLVSVCLFLCRYVGVFSAGILALAALYQFWNKKKIYGAYIAACAAVSLIVCSLYLISNKSGTGYLTGMPRSSAAETNLEMLIQFLIATVRSAFFPLYAWNPLSAVQSAIVVAYVAATIFILREIRRGPVRLFSAGNFDMTAFSFFAVGAGYLASIIVIRWISDFDEFNFRLLAPGALLILIAVLRHLEVANKAIPKSLRAFIGISVILSILAQGQVALLAIRNGLSYKENLAELYNTYKSVPAGSIIVFPPKHLAYMRTDLYLATPRKLPNGSMKESMNQLLQSLDKTRDVYVSIPSVKFDEKYYDSTLNRFIEQYEAGSLIKLDRT